jgi:hypothetical protein
VWSLPRNVIFSWTSGFVDGSFISWNHHRLWSRRSVSGYKATFSKPSLLLHLFLTTSDPDQFTIIPAPLKIIKVLIEELLSASGVQNAANQVAAAAEYADDEGDDDGWEDVPNILDLGSGATKEQLMAFGDGSASFMRQRDDETQAYLTEFFLKAANEDTAGFNEIYGALTEGEKLKLVELANK